MITHDNRFGWAMFSHGVAYELEYSWLYADGNELPYRTGDELKGKARKRLIDMKNNHTFYGVGAVREWTKAYVRYMYEENRPTGAKAFVARLQHRINKRPAAPAEIFTYPRTNLE